MENDDFKKNIDELFRLFKRLVEKHPIEDMPGMNRFQLEQLKLFLSNYESMRDQISFEMVNQVNEPMKEMLVMFIRQLREQLGEEAFESAIAIESPDAVSDKVSDKELDIKKIDELLTNPALTEAEIDNLLDQRIALQRLL
ncbi:MAG: hypothetical protein HOO86_02150 [Bacteroidales bacterium]|nr:hypothetical protein [Bacteroidales bacterium]